MQLPFILPPAAEFLSVLLKHKAVNEHTPYLKDFRVSFLKQDYLVVFTFLELEWETKPLVSLKKKLTPSVLETDTNSVLKCNIFFMIR